MERESKKGVEDDESQKHIEALKMAARVLEEK